jgi:MYXO-CTERM domain-containing protein
MRASRFLVVTAASLIFSCAAPVWAVVTVNLLNDTWADGDRTNTALPSDSADYVGISNGSGGSLTASPGKLAMVQGTSSQKLWTYFTGDNSAPDGNVTHNSVTNMGVGDTLTTSIKFKMPSPGPTAANTSKNFRFGLFFDPTDARVQTDVNSDGGGGTNPWQDATGYAIQMPINSSSSGTNPFILGKRTISGQTSLLGANGAYTNANSGGTAFALAADTEYTAQLVLSEITASQMDVTFNILQGATLLSTVTRSDTGSMFGTTAVSGSTLPGATSIYTKFDHLFFRVSDATQAGEYDFTNFNIDWAQVPEPTAATALLGLAALALKRRR